MLVKLQSALRGSMLVLGMRVTLGGSRVCVDYSPLEALGRLLSVVSSRTSKLTALPKERLCG